LEAAAEGGRSPPRLLVTYWPNGTLRDRYVPIGGRTGFQSSALLAPFEAAGLRDDMIALYGLSAAYKQPGGPVGEGGTQFVMTGADSPGARANGGEADDSVAGGPSFDQIFLKRVPELSAQSGPRYANALCDGRVDSLQISTRCLSYSYDTRMIAAATPQNGVVQENLPLLGDLSPSKLYLKLFTGFIPGTNKQAEAIQALRLRKSVLDSSLRELARLRAIVPSSEREKIDFHADAIRKVEIELQGQLDQARSNPTGCMLPVPPDATLGGNEGSHNDYVSEPLQADDAQLAATGKAHLAVIRAAFQCDLLRVATFQWCPGANHVAFQGMYPADPTGVYRYRDLIQKFASSPWLLPAPSVGDASYALYELLSNVFTWFNQKTADALADFKQAKDAFGNSLLDYTLVPYITEAAAPGIENSPMPALIFGGKALGMQGGQFVDLTTAKPSFSTLWLNVAQALFQSDSPQDALSSEVFMHSSNPPTAPIAGLWRRPT
jgi:hypothetical protein